jgi:hypothetical protein
VELVPGSHSNMDPDSTAVDMVVVVDRAVGTFLENTAIFVAARSSSLD